jgi:hypothetical protein
MAHATSWTPQATGEAPSPRCSAVGVRPDPLGGRPSGRGGREFCVSLVAGVPAKGGAGAGGQTCSGTSGPTVHRTETPTREAAGPRLAARRLPDRPLDVATGGRPDPPAVRRAVSSGACLEGADRVGLELPEAGASRRRARRGGHRPLDAGGLAPDKKTPRDVAPISSSSMRAGFCSSPTSAGRGRPRARRRASATGTATIACRCATGWRCRPSGGGWRSTSAVGPATSPVSTSRRSSATFSATCVVRSTCSGIAVPSIDGVRSARSSLSTPDSTSTTSRRTRRNSIRRSTCGPRLTISSPTEPRTISASSTIGWMARRAACVAPRISCGPASTPRIFHGRGEPFHYLRKSQ